ncbi:hypothetical protein E2C01_068034 [Portunus trituberculatus]|uniref:Uncharacterized protein n=1 Tax=Portunus trituberculatus TaxID=210409 RepID=A0A5B7HYE2_PORTR|nr:hypothetical protein [Portunus trituberculatus]
MPEAARRVGRSSVVMARAESLERSAMWWMWKRGQWSRKCSMVSGIVLHQGRRDQETDIGGASET